MLGSFNLITENGWYSAASRIALAAIVPASLIVRSFYPALSKFFVSSKEELQKTWDYLAEVMIFLAIPIVAGGILLAHKIITAFYGANFFPSIPALQLLIFVSGISFISLPYSVMLVVADQHKRNFYLIVFGAVTNVILNLILIPIFSLYGAIISTIISSLVIFFATLILLKRFTPILIFNARLIKAVLISCFSTFLMCLLVYFLLIQDTNIIIIVLGGGVAYFLVVFSFYRFLLHRHLFSNLLK
jgi:O-antigen/teichoic acid export membrane protein